MGAPRDSLGWTIRRAAAANRGGSGVRAPSHEDAEAAWASALPTMQLGERTPQRWSTALPPKPSTPPADTSVDLPSEAWPRVEPPVIACVDSTGAHALRAPRGLVRTRPGLMLNVLLERLGRGSFEFKAAWMLMMGLTRSMRIIAEHTLAPMPVLDDIAVCQRGEIVTLVGPDQEGLHLGPETRQTRRVEARATLLRLWAEFEGRGVFDMKDRSFVAVLGFARDVVREAEGTFEAMERALINIAPISFEELDVLVNATLPADFEALLDETIGKHHQRVAQEKAAAQAAEAEYQEVVAAAVAAARAREAVLAEHLQVNILKASPSHVPDETTSRYSRRAPGGREFPPSGHTMSVSLLMAPPVTTPHVLKLFAPEQAGEARLQLYTSRPHIWVQYVPIVWPYMVWETVGDVNVITLARTGSGIVHDVAYTAPLYSLRCAFIDPDGGEHVHILRLRGSRHWPRRCPQGVPLSRVLNDLSAVAVAVVAADINDDLDDVVDAASNEGIVVWEPGRVDNIHIGIDGHARVLAPSACLVDDPGPYVDVVRRCAPEAIADQVLAYRIAVEAVVGRAPSLSTAATREGRAEIEAVVRALIDDEVTAAYDIAADLASLSYRDFQAMSEDHPLFAQLAADAAIRPHPRYSRDDDDE